VIYISSGGSSSNLYYAEINNRHLVCFQAALYRLLKMFIATYVFDLKFRPKQDFLFIVVFYFIISIPFPILLFGVEPSFHHIFSRSL